MSGTTEKKAKMATQAHNISTRGVRISVDDVDLDGDLNMPADAHGVVLFAHGSGSSRFSPRNRYVADELNHTGFATLLMDLLSPEEEQIDETTAQYRFDIPLLGERLVGAIDWLGSDSAAAKLGIGCFGASTGAAAALVAAAQRPDSVAAVVSRGGRPDLAGDALPRVRAPTLLIVGGEDLVVTQLNESAMSQLRCERQLEIVPGASHLFEEPGALEEVARLAAGWFSNHLAGRHNSDCESSRTSASRNRSVGG
jgi:putative phosphoribosyl transferase